MKPLKDEIPIEPLSDFRWKKLDEAVFAALDAGEGEPAQLASMPPPPAKSAALRRLVFIGSGLAVAAVILAFVLRSVLTQGEVAVNPSHIETGVEPSRLAIGESSVEVAPSSSVVASGDAEHGVLVVLEKGKVDCEVAPRKGRPPFVVQAGDVRVRVVGTRFAVERRQTGVRVQVSHGAVEVSGAGETVLLHDGESWPRPLGSVDSLTPPSPAPSAAPSSAGSITAAAPSAMNAGSALPTTPQVPRELTDQRAYEGAARAESRDPEAAMVTYKKLAAGGGAWSQPALFAAGRLAADRGRNVEAKRHLESYLLRYPRGANAEDARQILSRLQ